MRLCSEKSEGFETPAVPHAHHSTAGERAPLVVTTHFGGLVVQAALALSYDFAQQ